LQLIFLVIISLNKAPEQINQKQQLDKDEISVIVQSITENDKINKEEKEVILEKIEQINLPNDLDLFIICISLILSGLILINMVDKCKEIIKFFVT
jgi:hypothetical protein